MKLSEFYFYLDWPVSIEVINLRKFVMANLEKKGKVIRWSIINIQKSRDSPDTKKIWIHAVLVD